MFLSQFEKTYNLENGWIGPYEGNNDKLMVSKHYKKPSQNGAYWHHVYLIIYKCKYCKLNALTENEGTVCCSRYSNCFSIHSAKQIAKDNIIHTRENPGIDSHGYYCWREQIIDKNGNKISTGDGNKRRYVYLHRYNMEQYLGRKLLKSEIIHHIDMDKTNNDIGNLWLCTDSQHKIAHNSFNKLCAEGMKKAVQFKFNVETGRYYLINQQ